MAKRIFDLVIASLSMAALMPLALIIAVGIKLDSAGPVIISTRRVGRGGKTFAHHRFRTMAGEPLRKTRFGRFIGNLSLEDIPTFWNVIRGDLSLIGPRPETPDKVDLADTDWQKVFSVKPGLSGLGLLTFLDRYNQTPIKDRIQPDVYYAEHQSLLFDMQLMLRTLYSWLKTGHLKGRF